MSPTRRIAAVVALGALALSACSSNDADAGDVVDALTDADIPSEQATCVGDGFEAEFDQGTLNDLASASSPEDFPSGTEETVDSILNECLDGTSGTDDEGDTTDTPSDTTDTTGDDAGDDTTPTTAG